MALKNNETNKDFYKITSDWTYDMYQSQTLWLRRTLLLLIITILLLTLSICSNLFLFPLKQTVPFLYAFDHSTGQINKIGKLEPTHLSADWELTRYLLIHYIINRESYDYYNLELPYQLAFAQSDIDIEKEYEDQVNTDNLNSPFKLYGKDKYITTHVTSISRLNENTVDIKFEKTLHDRISNTIQTIPKEAIVKWKYAGEELSEKMLERDPLGFKITFYQVNQVNLDNTKGV